MKKFKSALLIASLAATSLGAMAYDESFDSTISLYTAIEITEGQNLSFEPSLSKTAASVVTAPADTRAAIFSATGASNEVVEVSVAENEITMRLDGVGVNDSDIINVNTFTLGGSINDLGQATFDKNGDLNNMRVGGTAHVKATNVHGDYVGTATFRISYL